MRRIVIVSRTTRLDALVARFNTRQQARFYIEHLGADFADYEREHATYYEAVHQLQSSARAFGSVHLIDWTFLPGYIFGPDDIVCTIGQDGLVANTLKYLGAQPVIGFNSDPSRWDGLLSRFAVDSAGDIIAGCTRGRCAASPVTRALVRLSDGQELYAVNDFFVGVSGHTSARYTIASGGAVEYQSSSGVIVSTPLGASGWMRSIVEGAMRIAAGFMQMESAAPQLPAADWGLRQLTFAVREPFPSINTGTGLVFGQVHEHARLHIESRMGEGGVIFSDGIQKDFLHFNNSVTAEFTVAAEQGLVVTGF
jgi:NAD kinase